MSGLHLQGCKEPRKSIEVIAQIGFNAQNRINEFPIWAWRHDVEGALMKIYCASHEEISSIIQDTINNKLIKEEDTEVPTLKKLRVI